jgi:hypothetical protein
MYHFSYAGKDDRILNKLEHFSHASEIRKDWFDTVWKKWKPGMRSFHPVNPAAFDRAESIECPEEIKVRFNKYCI